MSFGVAPATTRIPAGTWELKVAHVLGWAESSGPDGGSGNGSLTVPADGTKVSFVYDGATHRTTVTVG